MHEDDHQIAIVLEKVEGPEMAEHLKKVSCYSEKRAAYMFYQVRPLPEPYPLTSLDGMQRRRLKTTDMRGRFCPFSSELVCS
jgi:hypothetical protein